jgi:molybdenum cofactor synthesis domain-containing protein
MLSLFAAPPADPPVKPPVKPPTTPTTPTNPRKSTNPQTTRQLAHKTSNHHPPTQVLFTTGGTGFTARDVTPEATRDVVGDRLAPALSEAMVRYTERYEPVYACVSRGVVGAVGRVLVVNLPGNPRAAAQFVEFLAPRLAHVVTQLAR